MTKRKIIKINENKCNGCGLCIPNCPEGALQVIDGKARLVSDLFCDGLGACIGECPEDAITIEEREAQKYDEIKVMENIAKQGENTIIAHLKHLKDHNETTYYSEAVNFLKQHGINISSGKAVNGSFDDRTQESCDAVKKSESSCPGAKIMYNAPREKPGEAEVKIPVEGTPRPVPQSRLNQWPIQINLIPPNASFLENADLVIAADCAAFSYADFHEDLLKEKILMIGCPKFDDAEYYLEKITEIFKTRNIKSVTVVHMEVPCCFALTNIVKQAIKSSQKIIPFVDINISVKGKKI